MCSSDLWKSHRLPLESGLTALPRVVVDAEGARRFHFGQWFAVASPAPDAVEGAVWDGQGRFLGVAAVDADRGLARAYKGGFLLEDAAAPSAALHQQ